MVGVSVTVGVAVAVAVAVGGSGVGVSVGTHPDAVHASQQLGNPVEQLPPPLGALHLDGLDLTRHLVFPLAVVRQQVTNPAGRPQVDLVAHFFTADEHARGSVPSATACASTPLAQRT